MTSSNRENSGEREIVDCNSQHSETKDIEAFGYMTTDYQKGIQMSNNKERKFGYSAQKTGGYSPAKSSGVTKSVQLPKGGSGSSGQPSASSGQSGSGQSGVGAGTKK